MERKQFRSRLFKRKIEPENVDYWYLLYAEVLFRMNEMDDYNCPCSFCRQERTHLKYMLFKLVKDGHIKPNRKPNFTGYGDCGRRLNPFIG
ncbi:MAG: hypothetical protein IPM56_11015 [Ignavibacteriales bacterium]|nr:MAG: hypothetical protein IPM56_11015 [Ignavibacteriales bacterium]